MGEDEAGGFRGEFIREIATLPDLGLREFRQKLGNFKKIKKSSVSAAATTISEEIGSLWAWAETGLGFRIRLALF